MPPRLTGRLIAPASHWCGPTAAPTADRPTILSSLFAPPSPTLKKEDSQPVTFPGGSRGLSGWGLVMYPAHTSTSTRSPATHYCTELMRTRAPQAIERYALKPIDASGEEAAVIENAQTTGPCSLDGLVRSLPSLCWGEVFVAVDRMSRDGRLLVRRSSYMTYELTLPPELASPRSPSRQEEP
jgi:hypothetical protein